MNRCSKEIYYLNIAEAVSKRCTCLRRHYGAIISASRRDMIGSTLYLAGLDAKKGSYVENANSCAMCKRLIINAGIEKVIIKDGEEQYRIIRVKSWIDDDDSITGILGY